MLHRFSHLLGRRAKPSRAPLDVAPDIAGSCLVFICGLHRSGTSVLHRVLQESPHVSGMRDTGVPQDEGQHLQSVFPPASVYGGPGRFAFHPCAHMTEVSARDAALERATILREWGPFYDLDRPVLIEKSPPNLIRSRYLQALFPGSKFIFIVRHPVPVSLSTRKWSKTTSLELILHWQTAHTLMLRDLDYIEKHHLIRYEDLASEGSAELEKICNFLEIDTFSPREQIVDQNDDYFAKWHEEERFDDDLLDVLGRARDGPSATFGYALHSPRNLPMRSAPGGRARR